MMSRFSLTVCLAVLSTVRAGNVAPRTTLSPSVGKQLLQEFRSMKQTLSSMSQNMTSLHDGLKGVCTSKQQPVPYSGKPSASSAELQAIKAMLTALDTKLEVTQTELKSTQTELKSTQTELKSTQTELKSTQTELKSTQTELAATEAKHKAAGKVLKSTQATVKSLQSNSKSGISGGSLFDHTGAAANPLCLTLTPQTDGTPPPRYYALLYGGEYDHVFNHHDHDVPCSVCLAPQPTTIMIPTTHTCPQGWTTQYRGYLSAGHPLHKAATQFVCLDKDPENASGGHVDRNGHLFYLTFTHCGSLPCPPYSNNQVVLCVVCSK